MNKKLPAFFSAALILLSGCSYSGYSYSYERPFVTKQYISEYPFIENGYMYMEIPESNETIPNGMTNKHIARIKSSRDGDVNVLALYSYDESGREIASTKGRYTVKREYDGFGNTTAEEKYIDGRLSGYTKYKYDIDQQLVSQRRYTSDGHTIYGADTFDIEYDSHGRIVSKSVYASKIGEMIKYYYRYNVSENSDNHQIRTDSNTINAYIKTYSDGGDHVISEEYIDNKSPENNYLLKYHYRIDERGKLSISILDSATGASIEERRYETDDISMPLDISKYDKDGNYIANEGYEYDNNGEIVVYGKSVENINSDYEVNVYIYNEKESGFDFNTNKANAYEIFEKDYDERISKIIVYRYYNSGKFREISVYDNLGECINKFVYRYNMKNGCLISCIEYDGMGVLVSKTEYTYDNFGNILTSKLYENAKLVETITYDYQVIPGAFCKPYTIEPKIRS